MKIFKNLLITDEFIRRKIRGGYAKIWLKCVCLICGKVTEREKGNVAYTKYNILCKCKGVDPYKNYTIDSDGCWIWGGSFFPNGYGQLLRGGAHRRFYEYYKGEIGKGMVVMHSCDTKQCVNPSHLTEGTILDNVKDRENKNRGCSGVKHPSSKLKEEDVIYIRNSTECTKVLAKKFGIARTNIYKIKKLQKWKNLTKG